MMAGWENAKERTGLGRNPKPAKHRTQRQGLSVSPAFYVNTTDSVRNSMIQVEGVTQTARGNIRPDCLAQMRLIPTSLMTEYIFLKARDH